MEKKINPVDLERENKLLRKQLAELDELPGKNGTETVSGLKGVRDIPTSVSKKIHSAPRRQGDHDYLNLYLLQKERERLAKEIALVKKRRLQLGMKVSNVDKGMAEKEGKTLPSMTILSREPTINKAESHKKTGKKQKAPKRYEYKEEEWNKFTLGY